MIHTSTMPYNDNETSLEGFVAFDPEEQQPLVILCHSWQGRNAFICEKAELMARSGYVGFALDMYGKGILGHTNEENAALKAPFIQDRALLQRRVLKAFDAASSLPYVDTTRIAVLGFGFGGVCALDLARSGAPLKGAISVYGHFDPPHKVPQCDIQAKVLVLHGYDDAIVPLSELRHFEKEMTDAKVDWQAHIYSNTMHAFANPHANDPQSGIAYNEVSANRAWVAIANFLDELFPLD